MNLNAVVIGPDGTIATGEDFLLKEIKHNHNVSGDWGLKYDDRFSIIHGNYYGNVDESGSFWEYHLSRPASNDEKELFNLCRDVPDVSKKPFPKDSQYLDEGWWYALSIDTGEPYDLYFSNYMRKCSKWDSSGLFFAHAGSKYYCEYYLQYLVIDGRIIHTDDLMNTYPSCHVTPRSRVLKTANGYVTRIEVEATIYGEKCKVTSDIEYKGVNGPKVVYDLSDYFKIDGNDENEMNNLSETRSNEPTRVIEKKSFPEKKSMPREDGKTFEFDRSLPKSIGNLSRTRTIYPQSK